MKWFTHPPEVYWRAYYRRRHKRLHRIPENEQTCLNCGTVYHGNYCPVCGQSHLVKSLTLLHILRNLWLSLIMLRKGYAITLLELTGHPGYFMRRYIRGHRIPYVHPFRLLLVLLAVYVLLSITFMPEQLPKEQSFGFMDYLTAVRTDDWRQTVAQFLISVLQYIHKTPLLQMAAERFENWFFQNPALQALTFFPFFAILSYTLFHSGVADNKKTGRRESSSEDEDGSDDEKVPGFFESTIKEPLTPLWAILRAVRRKQIIRLYRVWLKFKDWWIRNFGYPKGGLKVLKACGLLYRRLKTWLKTVVQYIRKEIKTDKTVVRPPLTYDFMEVIYMRGYFTCLLMEINLILFIWGLTITPFNIWVIAGTVWIYKNFFRWRWWDAVKRTFWLYVLTFFLAGLYCTITSVMDVIKG